MRQSQGTAKTISGICYEWYQYPACAERAHGLPAAAARAAYIRFAESLSAWCQRGCPTPFPQAFAIIRCCAGTISSRRLTCRPGGCMRAWYRPHGRSPMYARVNRMSHAESASRTAEIKRGHDYPHSRKPGRSSERGERADTDGRQPPHHIGQQPPGGREDDDRKDAPAKVIRDPEEVAHHGCERSATGVSPARTRSPTFVRSVAAAGNSSTTVLPSRIRPMR